MSDTLDVHEPHVRTMTAVADRDSALALVDRTIGAASLALVTGRLARDETLLLSGSLVAGLGNHRSDLDFYVLSPSRTGGSRTQMALAGERYVDCERLDVASLRRLADRIRVADVDDHRLAATSLSDLDLYYRVAIAVPIANATRHADVLGEFEREIACAGLHRWAALHADANSARARTALAAGRARHAGAYAIDAGTFALMSELAALGDGYASPKWTVEKARRAFGDDSSRFAECLRALGMTTSITDRLDVTLDWVAERTAWRDPRPAAASVPATGVRALATALDGFLLARGREAVHHVLPEDVWAVRHLLGEPVPVPELSTAERDALLAVVAADLTAAKILIGGTPR